MATARPETQVVTRSSGHSWPSVEGSAGAAALRTEDRVATPVVRTGANHKARRLKPHPALHRTARTSPHTATAAASHTRTVWPGTPCQQEAAAEAEPRKPAVTQHSRGRTVRAGSEATAAPVSRTTGAPVPTSSTARAVVGRHAPSRARAERTQEPQAARTRRVARESTLSTTRDPAEAEGTDKVAGEQVTAAPVSWWFATTRTRPRRTRSPHRSAAPPRTARPSPGPAARGPATPCPPTRTGGSARQRPVGATPTSPGRHR